MFLSIITWTHVLTQNNSLVQLGSLWRRNLRHWIPFARSCCQELCLKWLITVLINTLQCCAIIHGRGSVCQRSCVRACVRLQQMHGVKQEHALEYHPVNKCSSGWGNYRELFFCSRLCVFWPSALRKIWGNHEIFHGVGEFKKVFLNHSKSFLTDTLIMNIATTRWQSLCVHRVGCCCIKQIYLLEYFCKRKTTMSQIIQPALQASC